MFTKLCKALTSGRHIFTDEGGKSVNGKQTLAHSKNAKNLCDALTHEGYLQLSL
jgi:hypothetical protein